MFVGPALCVPFIILAIFGVGYKKEDFPILVEIAMKFSFLRYSLEGVVAAMMFNRESLFCPIEEVLCPFQNVDFFLRVMNFENSAFWISLTALTAFVVVFRGICFYLLRQRLSPGKTFRAIQVIGRLVKTQFNLSR